MSNIVRIHVERGPARGQVVAVEDGQSVVLGRGTGCDLVVPDSGLSRRHLEIAWDGSTCRLADLGSTNGTFVGGRAVTEIVLRHGDEVEAGETRLRIEITEAPAEVAAAEGVPESGDATPVSAASSAPAGAKAAASAGAATTGDVPGAPRVPVEIFANVEPSTVERPPVVPAKPSPLATLAGLLAEARDARLYAIVDGASDIELAMTARLLGRRLFTLFEGDMAIHVAHAGPILIPLEAEPLAFLEKWVEALGKNAGVLLQTSAELPALFAQLRHIFVVKDEEGQEYFLRFYDPRVLRGFLPTCTPDERAEFFGPVTRWIVENETGDAYLVVTPASFTSPDIDAPEPPPS